MFGGSIMDKIENIDSYLMDCQEVITGKATGNAKN